MADDGRFQEEDENEAHQETMGRQDPQETKLTGLETVTRGAALAAFYGPETARRYDTEMDDEMKKVVEDLDHVIAHAPAGTGVLDTCVGSGHYLAYLSAKRKWTHVVGMDVSDAMLATARVKLPDATFLNADMLETPLPDAARGPFGVVLNNFSLHHAARPDAEAAIMEFASRLVDGGVLYVSLWAGEGAVDFGEASSDMAALLTPERELVKWLASAGLEVSRRRSVVEKDMGGMTALYVVASKGSSSTKKKVQSVSPLSSSSSSSENHQNAQKQQHPAMDCGGDA